MKRVRFDRLSGQLQAATPVRRPAACTAVRASRPPPAPWSPQRRCQTTSAAAWASSTEDAIHGGSHGEPIEQPPSPVHSRSRTPLPSPHPDRAPRSAKLAALHARLSLSSKIPPQTLARALVDPSADDHPRFNNANLAYVGAALLQYHASEWLITRYPRLPMAILFAAMKGYVGGPALQQIARAWGVEAAAAPGEEVDPGLLQFSTDRPSVAMTKLGFIRTEAKEIEKYKFRRGMSSRVLYDDAFGEMLTKPTPGADGAKEITVEHATTNAYSNAVRAIIGAIYLHCGRDAAKQFIRAHVMARTLDLANLFAFRLPTRELARLCNRENFEPPVARLLSETGRASRTPVFVVGIYSGADKLGEHAGPSLDTARTAAAISALKSWYLYSPGAHVNLPSDALAEDAPPFKPVHVDMGEIIS
ncbi:ribonuclease III, partial [Xylariaceae sp. FL0804]